ncbi:MAG: hypothetical protein KAR40_10860, partial [Candidatus Sabulitectum sp.]|nr:hypothetical protein [Candidatus Sabulitectum sp.]
MMRLIIPVLVVAMISAGSDVSQSQAHAFHEYLGEMIDAEENSEYNVFGNVEGFSAAKLYSKNGNSYSLHLLRNFHDHAQLLIIDLSQEKFDSLYQTIAQRCSTITEGLIMHALPAFQIDESDWDENSVNRKIVLLDGSEIIGTLENAVGDTLMVLSAGGLLIAIPDDKIGHIAELRGEFVEGELVRHDPNTTRLFFAPTARNIRSGSGYFADYMVFFPTVAYGITDNVAISGGVSLIPGAKKQVWFLAPKISYNISPALDAAIGAFLLDPPGDENSELLGYSVMTYGDRRKSLTLGFALSLESGSEDNHDASDKS